jgi:hypothetical protein
MPGYQPTLERSVKRKTPRNPGHLAWERQRRYTPARDQSNARHLQELDRNFLLHPFTEHKQMREFSTHFVLEGEGANIGYGCKRSHQRPANRSREGRIIRYSSI